MLTRRRLFGAAALAGLGAAVLAIGLGANPLDARAAAKEIRVLNWQGYGTDETWATGMFEKKTGYKVVHDYFTSEQEMLTKLRTAPGTYDVVLMNSTYVPQAIKDIQPYVDRGDATPALEFQSPVKGPALEQITVEVGSGLRSAAAGAALYDQDVKKEAQQLGLKGW